MNVLVVSPHPDDETLGAGGTILRLKEEGNKIFWLNITGMTKGGIFSEEMQERRKEQLKKIEDFYKFEGTYNLNLPTAQLDSYNTSDAIDKIREVFTKVQPEMLILPDYNDAHSDHKKVFEWCYSCSKVFRFPYIKKIMTMEIVSETDFGKPENPFIPNFYVDITEYLEEKINALNIYDTELGEPPFPRSIEHVKALATVRGAAAGVKYAEAFRMIKYIM
mgnify:FL=1